MVKHFSKRKPYTLHLTIGVNEKLLGVSRNVTYMGKVMPRVAQFADSTGVYYVDFSDNTVNFETIKMVTDSICGQDYYERVTNHTYYMLQDITKGWEVEY